jgi:hypothetical protein
VLVQQPRYAPSHYLIRFLEEVRQDRGALLELMRRLQFPCNRGKITVAWAAEKVGRLKLNGQLKGYSDLSRLLELEGLCLGVEGKLSGGGGRCTRLCQTPLS